MTPANTTEIIKRQTVAQMVDAFQTASAEIAQAYAILETAETRLKASFEDRYGFDTNDRDCHLVGKEATERIIGKIKRAAWSAVAKKMEYRRILSTKRLADFNKQVESGDLPELTSENIFALAESMIQNFPAYMEESCAEVFDFIRPRKHWGLEYKTNAKFQNEIGERCVLGWMIEHGYGKPFQVRYGSEQKLRNLANVFQLLDGKGPVTDYHGPLVTAIQESADGTGKTEYFEFKCFHNGNLHLKFLRMDLVRELSAKAGTHLLRKGEAA
jgi:hypothetical protein